MIEKVVTLDNISLIDFLGVENKTIDTLSAAFPKSRIVSRGNQILLRGATAEIVQINDVLNSLMDHYHKYGRVTQENVQAIIDQEHELQLEPIFLETQELRRRSREVRGLSWPPQLPRIHYLTD